MVYQNFRSRLIGSADFELFSAFYIMEHDVQEGPKMQLCKVESIRVEVCCPPKKRETVKNSLLNLLEFSAD